MISNIKFKQIYEKALYIRAVEQKISIKYNEQKMRCPVHLSIGQEIAPSILSLFLNKSDKCMSTHRCHAHYLSRDGDLKKMIAELYGKKTGCSKGYGGSMHLVDIDKGFMGTSAIVGSSIPLALGLALNLKINKSNSIAISFFGEGAREEGAFFESINLAIIKKLPIIFFCENNFYSVYTPLKKRKHKMANFKKMLSEFGIKSYYSNGKKIENIYSNINSAVKFVRKNKLPCYIEIDCYRNIEHCGPNNDDKLGYRDKVDFNIWKEIDLLIDLEKKLIKKNLYSKKQLINLKLDLDKYINYAFAYAEKSRAPLPNDAYRNLFA
jgi:pyruvate dehydrogenase E1 component alpha subunit